LQADLEEEKELNKCLISNQETNQNKLNKLEMDLKRSNEEFFKKMHLIRTWELKYVLLVISSNSPRKQLWISTGSSSFIRLEHESEPTRLKKKAA